MVTELPSGTAADTSHPASLSPPDLTHRKGKLTKCPVVFSSPYWLNLMSLTAKVQLKYHEGVTGLKLNMIGGIFQSRPKSIDVVKWSQFGSARFNRVLFMLRVLRWMQNGRGQEERVTSAGWREHLTAAALRRCWLASLRRWTSSETCSHLSLHQGTDHGAGI